MGRAAIAPRRTTPRFRRRWRLPGERGSAAVELAILMPAILLLTFGSIQVATMFLARNVALGAAQEAATAERTYNAAPGSGQVRAQAFLARSGDWLTEPTVTVTHTGNQITTTVDGWALTIVPGLRWRVHQVAHAEAERFTTENDP